MSTDSELRHLERKALTGGPLEKARYKQALKRYGKGPW